MSNYFTSDDRSVFIPFSAAGDLWNTRYPQVLIFEPVAPQFEKKAEAQVLAAIATRQGFSPTDKKAIQMFGREEFRPVIDGLTIGLQVLLLFIGALTLGIGGVGVMNIMLVSVDERIREIGLRRALGARKWHIRLQFLAETMMMMLLGGVIGIMLSYALSAVLPTLPLLGPLFEDTIGQGRHSPADFGHGGAGLGDRVADRRRVQRDDPGAQGVEAGSGGGAAVRVASRLSVGGSLRARVLIQMGEPTKPKASRIWFSRKR